MRDTTLQLAAASVKRRGFFDLDDPIDNNCKRLAEEVGEFMRAMRRGENIAAELADVVIVCASLAHLLGIDLDKAIIDKCVADEMRGRLHGSESEYGGALTRVPVPVAPDPMPDTYYENGKALHVGNG